MNSDNSEIRSKYFVTNSAMDESLSDFQETKKSCAGPKNTTKTKSIKPKKAPKRIRGQKDIRTALRSKKNELESYSKDFDKVCKKAGIDVDSEQLQLAIALSKSLQNTPSISKEPSESIPSLNTQDRIGKIRTTLQEYGFKVPDVKIATNTRKIKKSRKNYKLILASDTEKKEIIVDKYSQVLFKNIIHCSLYSSEVNNTDIPLYYLATNVSYDILKKTDVFYVHSLIEICTNSGNLLRDWAEIPGRPVSPQHIESDSMNFSEIECSQDELDIVLSGSLKRCKNVLRNKHKSLDKKTSRIVIDKDVNKCVLSKSIVIEDNNISNHDKTLKVECNKLVYTTETVPVKKLSRSYSPDLFDDDASLVFDNSNNTIIKDNKSSSEVVHKTITDINLGETSINVMGLKECQSSVNDGTKRKSNDFMELTKCCQSLSKDNFRLLSQKSNLTNRKSNDFMEITECVPTVTQQHHHIDLTQGLDIIEDNTTAGEIVVNKCHDHEVIIHEPINAAIISDIDLTESPENQKDNLKSSTETTFKPDNINYDKSIENLDLTQSSNTSDELPFVSLTGVKNVSLDTTIIVNYDYADIDKVTTHFQNNAEVHIDLTQNVREIDESNHSQSFFDEFIHNHSGHSEVRETGNSSDKSHGCIEIEHNQNSKTNCYGVTCINLEDTSHTDKEYCISQSKPDNTSTSNSRKELANFNIIGEPSPIESDSGFRSSKADEVGLTQISECSKDSHHLNGSKSVHNHKEYYNPTISPYKMVSGSSEQSKRSFINCKSTTAKEIYSLPQSKYDNKNSPDTVKESSSNIIEEEPIPVELYHSNTGLRSCEPGEIDLTQDLETNNYKTSKNTSSNEITERNASNCKQSHVDLMSAYGHDKEDKLSHRNKYVRIHEPPAKNHQIISPIKQSEDSGRNNLDDEISDIDLTQSSGSSVELSQTSSKQNTSELPLNVVSIYDIDKNISMVDNNPIPAKSSQRYSSLGKKDDISIDYDEYLNNDPISELNKSRNASNKSIIHDNSEENLNSPLNNDSFLSNCSQNSGVFEISDKELDYSMHKSKLELDYIDRGNFVFGGISVMDEISNFGSDRRSDCDSIFLSDKNTVNKVDTVEIESVSTKKTMCNEISPIKHRRKTEIEYTPTACSSNTVSVVTPKNSELIIKTNNITPMLDYESMSISEIHEELDKYGIKPFKRKRAIQLLKHIYNQTHPIIEEFTDEHASPSKRHKPNEDLDISPKKRTPTKVRSPRRVISIDNVKENTSNIPETSKSKGKSSGGKKGKKSVRLKENVEINCNKGTEIEDLDIIEDMPRMERFVSDDAPVLKEVECRPEDWVFQKRERAKIQSCRVPLHIAFHNYVASRRDLREAILCYQPVEIDIIHKDLVAYGHRYDPKELLKYLDKKCITIKTDNDARNSKR